MKVKFQLSIGFPTATRSEIEDIEGWEDLTEEQKDEILAEWVNEKLEYRYEEIV